MLYLITGWLACAVLTFGIVCGDFWHEYPTLQGHGRFRELAGTAVIFALGGPIGLVVTVLSSGFCRHGLLFREPRS